MRGFNNKPVYIIGRNHTGTPLKLKLKGHAPVMDETAEILDDIDFYSLRPFRKIFGLVSDIAWGLSKNFGNRGGTWCIMGIPVVGKIKSTRRILQGSSGREQNIA